MDRGAQHAPAHGLDLVRQGFADAARRDGARLIANDDRGLEVWRQRRLDLAQPASRNDLDRRIVAVAVEEDDPSLRFFLGYAEWTAGQLEDEIEQGLWWLGPPGADLVFSAQPDEVWQRALFRLGGPYRAMSLIPENPRVN